MVCLSGLEEEKTSCESFFNDRRRFVILLKRKSVESKCYKPSDRSALGLRSNTYKPDEPWFEPADMI